MEEFSRGSTLIHNNAGNLAPARVVRVNWLKFLLYSWRRISTLSKLIVTCSVLLIFAQIATAIAILLTSRNESCDQPLRTFITIHAVSIFISCPFYIGEHFQKAEERLSHERRQERDRRREEQVRMRRLQRREARQRARESGVTTEPVDAVLPSNASIVSTATIVQPRSNCLTEWGVRFKALIDLFAVLWFIVGNYLIFTAKTCSREAPQLYFTSLTFILIGYFILILPLVLCTSVILCLPCVLMVMRELHMNEMSGMDQGGRSEEISKIPVFRFNSSAEEGQTQQQGVTTKPSNANKGFLSKLLQRYRNHSVNDLEGGSFEDMFISPAEDALCCICLSEYEEKDLLCRLWCGHHFHQSCLKEWLILNRKCPLCKQDFRGKEYDEDSDNEDENDDIVEGESSRRHENDIPMHQLSR